MTDANGSEPLIRGVFNLRDLGGIPAGDGVTRPGMVFRADGIHRTDGAGAEAIVALGVRRVIDLRTLDERETDGWFRHPEVTTHAVPIVERMGQLAEVEERPDGDLLLDLSLLMLERSGDRFARAIDLIVDGIEAGEPVLFHCTAGKDRTGLLAALLLGAVGAADEVIAEDYARSATNVAAMVAWYTGNAAERLTGQLTRSGMAAETMERMLRADASTATALLKNLRAANGEVANLLATIGVSPGAIAVLQRRWVEPLD